MTERLFHAAVLVACAAAAVLVFAEPGRVAARGAAPATPVVQLERVVVTAAREDGRTLAAGTEAAPADRAVQ